MTVDILSEWSLKIGEVTIGATTRDGGTRRITRVIGGESELAFIGKPATGHKPLIAFELCDDMELWSPIISDYAGDIVNDAAAWAGKLEKDYAPDLLRLYMTSSRRREFSDFPAIGRVIEDVLQGTGLSLIVEGSDDPKIDSEIFQRIGEAGEGEKFLLGTAEAGRYRSVAAAAMAYGHSVIAQSPIDINLAKQLTILLREIGVPNERIVIDPYTGALGYGFEYSYSVMERIRYSALKGDQDLAMPMISSAVDSLNIKEVREASPDIKDEIAVKWELYTAISAAVAGSSIVCVRHPATIAPLREAIDSLWMNAGKGEA
ncbi:MAG TPA: acetyl-CoA decarbonylase/synthase complex subunit delta [Methanoregulaceae archaeon]|nr:acetyl-CoA decarbonylase/synthase complex subunit delta [Methanoregulaceae archaeon]